MEEDYRPIVFEFDEFAIYSKTLELLERYGIKPTSVAVNLSNNDESRRIYWSITDRTTDVVGSTYEDLREEFDSEQHKRLNRLYSDLGGGLGKNENYTLEFLNRRDLYDKLDAALEKAPKPFTRHR